MPELLLQRLSEFIANAMGLHYPRERWQDLQRGLADADAEFGFAGLPACAEWLLSTPLTPARLQVLANHLTIGETYFLRGKRTHEALTGHILPKLIDSRRKRGRERRLRLWSAACCTGEEAYSLAILLRQLLPDPAEWHVNILATDLNAGFLRKAAVGSYGKWSFRDAPDGFRERYFTRGADGRYTVVPEIRQWVTFAPLNLVEDVYPSLATGTEAMDLIFCRNVLMYFAPAQVRKVIGNLHRSLAKGGWLAVSPSETSQALFSQFATRNFPGAILYQKSDAKSRESQPPAPPTPPAHPAFSEPAEFSSLPLPAMPQPESPGSPPETVPPPESPAPAEAQPAPDPAAMARMLANQGKLAEALDWCDRWIAADKLDSASHYLRAMVLLEQGQQEEARQSLQRAVYLQPDFVLAHFALGSLARGRGKTNEAGKHFANALRLLHRIAPEDLLSEADHLTAGRLTETITAMTAMETAR